MKLNQAWPFEPLLHFVDVCRVFIRCAESHRLGNVAVEEASIIVAVSLHRKLVIAQGKSGKTNQRYKDGPVVESPPVPLQNSYDPRDIEEKE